MNPLTTGGMTLAGTQLSGVVKYFAALVHLPPPDDATAGLIGVGILMGVHAVWNYINARWPAPAQPHPVAPIPVPQNP
jgi:hypothetical protein